MKRRTLIRSIMAAAGMLCGSVLMAQTATLTGTVTDKTGAVIPSAQIKAIQTERNVKFEVTSDAAGRYTLQNLPIGSFVIEARADGFKLYRRTGVELTVDLRGLVNIALEVGEVSQAIDVQGDASRVDTQTTTIQQLVDSQRVEQLPLNGRDVYNLAKLVPGTGVSGFSVGGGREGTWGTTTNVRLDGGSNNDRTWLKVLSSPSPDAVEEFSIQTSVPSAKYGFSAGVIEVATKSGTNELHGALYEFLRNDALNGRNFFAATQTKLKRNQYGIAAGGPVWLPKVVDGRNKLFWFFNWEQQKQPATTLTTIYTPTAAQRQGDFSGSKAITDPLTKQAFPGNVIPSSRMDKIATNVISQFVPLPQESNGLYRYQTPNDNNPRQILGRMDYHSGANQFTYRAFLTANSKPVDRGTLPYFNGAGLSSTDTGNHTFTFTRIVTPALINVFRFSANKYLSGTRPDPARDNFPIETLRTMGWAQNYYAFGNTLPELGVTGFFTAGSWRYYWYDHGDNYSLDDDVSFIRGRHSMDFGFNFTLVNETKDDEGSGLAGQYAFNGATTGSALADFLIGKPSSFLQRSVEDLRLRSNSFAWYFQDNIKVRPRLTLNLGVRYELPVAASNGLREFMVFLPGSTQKSQQFVNAPPGLLFPGDSGVSDKARATPTNQIGPRVGFTYALTADQKTVLRAGYGLMYNPSWLQQEAQFAEKNPFNLRQAINAPPSTADPWADYPGGNIFPGKVRSPDYVFYASAGASYARNFTDPNMQQWNVNIQREIARDYLIKAAYVGTKGTHLMLRNDINAAEYIPGASTLANLDSRRPYAPQMAAIDWITSDGNSSYHSAQLSLDKRFGHGFSIQGAYTFSKAIDLQSGGWDSYPQDSRNWAAERSPSTSDRTHVFRTSWVWSLPFASGLRGVPRLLLGGWDLTGILSLYSGAPLAMTESVDRALRGLTNRPDRLSDPRVSGERSKSEMLAQYFNTSAYSRNQTGQFGNAPRAESQLRGPGTIALDAGVVKHFRFTDRHRVDLRGEFFNLPNHANFSSPGTNIGASTSFGRITSAGDPRIIQLALKYVF